MRVDELIDLDLAYAPPFSQRLGPDPPSRRPRRASARSGGTSAAHLADCGMALTRGAGGPRGATARSWGARSAGPTATLVDAWLAELLAGAEAECGRGGVALVAVGGYGRAELSLQSDIDVAAPPRRSLATSARFADRVWYPIWDEGLKLGHAVRTTREALTLAADDLDTATSLLQIRHLAGDADLTDDLRRPGARAVAEAGQALARGAVAPGARSATRPRARWRSCSSPTSRRAAAGCATCTRLRWAEAARSLLWEGDDPALEEAYDALLSARVELHRRTGRPGDRLLLEEQDAVAGGPRRGVGRRPDAHAWRRPPAPSPGAATTPGSRIDASLSGPLGWRARRDQADRARPRAPRRRGPPHRRRRPGRRPEPRAARRGGRRGRRHPHPPRLARSPGRRGRRRCPTRGRPRCGRALVDLLLAGHRAIPVIEALDQIGLWVHVLPEWEAVRSKPQRNAYHRFTVDRHLMETAPTPPASSPAPIGPTSSCSAPCSTTSARATPATTPRSASSCVADDRARAWGSRPTTSRCSQAMVRHHLLLPDVATRRDLDDPATIETVAEAVGDLRTLGLLAGLTEADSLATGPAAWGPWKADLVRDLVGSHRPRARRRHGRGGARRLPDRRAPRAPAGGQQVLRGEGDRLTVVAADRQGLFSRVTGVLALHGLGVLDAAVTSLDGMALEVLRVESSFGPTIAWEKVIADLEKVLEGRLALQARLAERARVYGGRQQASARCTSRRAWWSTTARPATPPWWRCTPSTPSACSTGSPGPWPSSTSTSCRAKVQTLGDRVVDAFYVRDMGGEKLTDPAALVEVERALLHELASDRSRLTASRSSVLRAAAFARSEHSSLRPPRVLRLHVLIGDSASDVGSSLMESIDAVVITADEARVPGFRIGSGC